MTARIFRLLQQHQSLDQALRDEQRSVQPDSLRMQKLKILKLAVKDRLHRMSTRSQRPLAF
jgi:uncharacterized protein